MMMNFTAVRKGKKEIKGEMYFAGKPVFDEETESLRFDEPEFDVKSDNGLANIGIRLKKRKIINQIKKSASYPVGDFLREARKEMQQMGYYETDFASFRVKNPSLDIEGLLLTMYNSHLRLSNQVVEEVQKHFNNMVFDTIIHRNVKLSEAPSFGESIINYDATSKGASNYLNLAEEIIKKNQYEC